MRGLQTVTLCVAAIAAAVSALPTNGTSACASVSAAIVAHPTTTPTVPAKLAYDCLTSIPFNASSASALIDSMKPYVGWQSTLAYLKDPPAEYAEKVQPAVDIYAGLDAIKGDIAAGKYSSEYEFGVDLYNLFLSAHDGHFSFVPDSVGLLFTWARPLALVSLSEDGEKFPAVFVYSDVVGSYFKNISYTPSAVALINGLDVATQLEKFSQAGSLQDRDALYNNLFYNLAQVSLGSMGSGTGMFSGSGRGRFVYPGPTTTLNFTNGSSITVENFARVAVSFNGIKSGDDLAQRYFTYSASAGSVSAGLSNLPKLSPIINVAEKRQTTKAPPPGYPKPIVQATSNVISGYFLEGEGYDDVAVLAVPSFVSIDTLEKEFQIVGDQFIQKAKDAGKTKLIIDVSANGGGTVLQGYDLFKKLFPTIDPYGASRLRAHEAVDKIGQAFSDFAANHPRTLNEPNSTVLSVVSSYFNYRSDVDVDNKNFDSWASKYGPHQFHGDNFTSLTRWNLSDVLLPVNSGGIEISGFGNRSNITEQPFKAENMVVVYDGYCASTCTIFSELMRQQAGVKTIAMGGRPQLNPIQAVGGVKGVLTYPWQSLQSLAQLAVSLGASKTGELADYYNDLVFYRTASSPGANIRDGLRQGDEEETPLQFVFEPADCRLWYTPEMTVDASAIWRAAADAQWNKKRRCVFNGNNKRMETTTQLNMKRETNSKRSGGIAYEDLVRSLEVFTDLSGLDLSADGFMMP